MTLKNWVLARVHQMNGLVSRGDLPGREPEFESTLPGIGDSAPRTPRGIRAAAREPVLSSPEHLGAYGPLIGAIRAELDHFVSSQVRLHLAIADRDRFILTSIGIGCHGSEPARQLLQQFLREFKPEQLRRYLAREVIGALPNAAAIDLSQFAGLFDADAHDAAAEEAEAGEYRELLAALRIAPAAAAAGGYRVNVLGRWAELDPARAQPSPAQLGSTPSTPLSGQRCEFDVEDAAGRRRVVLQGVVAGRRYVVGTGDGCDLRVDGTFTSRRHAELWLDKGSWWVADAGSTNGLRIEPQSGVFDPGRAVSAVATEPARLLEGMRIVLSARAEGVPGEYPWLALRPLPRAASLVTPIAASRTPATAILPVRADPAAPQTPTTEVMKAGPGSRSSLASPTEVLPGPAAEAMFRVTVSHAAGARTVELDSRALPFSVGRSRNQALVVDRRHDGVSGQHLEVVALDDAGATVIVHGDNGVLSEGVHRPAGERFHWPAGTTLVLGGPAGDPAACSLVLKRTGGA